MKKKNSIAFHIGQRLISIYFIRRDSIYFIRRFGHLWDSVFDHVISTERYSIGWIKLMIWYGHQDLVLWENGNKHIFTIGKKHVFYLELPIFFI